MTWASTQSDWARVLLTSLADAGVHDVVISPGSRSTSFVLAALRLEAAGRLHCHDIVDERSAGFFALGRARVTGRPALLLCTSGSAAAHYFPAVVEAEADHLPVLILSADRPVELQHCGANQTLDQLHLFGRHVRRFVDLGLADEAPDALRALRRAAAQAVFSTRWPTPGAVHLNARARKPLEPDATESESNGRSIDDLLARPLVEPAAPRRMPARLEIDLFLERAAQARSGLVVAGPAHLDQGAIRDRLRLLASRLRWPILADATSQLRDGDSMHGGGALLDTSFAERFAPEMVLQIGRSPAASSWGRRLKDWCLADPATDHWVLAAEGWNDAESTASHLLFGDVDAGLDRLLDRLELHQDLPHEQARAFEAAWRTASELARGLSYELSHEPSGAETGTGAELTESAAVRRVVEALPPDVQLVLGNSLPVREVDLWVAGEEFDGRPVLHQRGLSGIDGGIAGAVGAALAGTPTLLLLGDVSLRHDLGSLELARRVPDLVIVVIDNGGGRIFEHLPLAQHPEATDEVLRHWLQPADLDLEKACEAQGLRYLRPASGVDLTAAVPEALSARDEGRGAWLLDVKVAPSSAVAGSRELGRRLQQALEDEGLA